MPRSSRRCRSDLAGVAAFVASYYQEPLGLVIAQMIPPLERRREHASRIDRAHIASASRCKCADGARRRRCSASAASSCATHAAWQRHPVRSRPSMRRAQLPAYLRIAVKRWRAAGFAEMQLRQPIPVRARSPRTATEAPPLSADQRRAGPRRDRARARPVRTVRCRGDRQVREDGVYLAAPPPRCRRAASIDPRAGSQPDAAIPAAHRGCVPARRSAMLRSRVSASERLRHWKAAAAGESSTWCSERGSRCSLQLPRLALVVVETKSTIRRSSSRTASSITAAMSPSGARGGCEFRSCSERDPLAGDPRSVRSAGATAGSGLPLRAAAPARPTADRVRSRPGRACSLEGVSAPLLAAIELRIARGRAGARVHQPPRLCAVAACGSCGWQAGCPRCSARLVVHRDARMLRCHHCGHARAIAGCVPGLRQRRPAAGRSRHAAPRTRARRAFPGRAHRAHRSATARAGRAPSPGVRDRVHARRGRHPRRHADAREGARLSAPHAGRRPGRRQRALQRRFSRDRAPGGAARSRCQAARGPARRPARRGDRANGLPGPIRSRRARPSRLRQLRRSAALPSVVRRRLPPFAHLHCSSPRRRGAMPSTRSSPPQATRAASVARAAGVDVEVFPPVPATLRAPRRTGARAGAGAEPAERTRRCSAFFRIGGVAIDSLPGRRVRFALDVDPLGFALRASHACSSGARCHQAPLIAAANATRREFVADGALAASS